MARGTASRSVTISGLTFFDFFSVGFAADVVGSVESFTASLAFALFRFLGFVDLLARFRFAMEFFFPRTRDAQRLFVPNLVTTRYLSQSNIRKIIYSNFIGLNILEMIYSKLIGSDIWRFANSTDGDLIEEALYARGWSSTRFKSFGSFQTVGAWIWQDNVELTNHLQTSNSFLTYS